MYDVPARIEQPLNMGAIWLYYANLPPQQVKDKNGNPVYDKNGDPDYAFHKKTTWARIGFNLAPETQLPVTDTDRLAGSLFLSDHLPVILEVDLP